MPETDQAVLMEILQRITKIETKIESLTNLDRVAAEAYAVANEALQSTKGAHHRLDRIDTQLQGLDGRSDRRTSTAISLGALAVAAITLILRMVGA